MCTHKYRVFRYNFPDWQRIFAEKPVHLLPFVLISKPNTIINENVVYIRRIIGFMKRIFLSFFIESIVRIPRLGFLSSKKLSQNWKFELWMHSLSVTPNWSFVRKTTEKVWMYLIVIISWKYSSFICKLQIPPLSPFGSYEFFCDKLRQMKNAT